MQRRYYLLLLPKITWQPSTAAGYNNRGKFSNCRLHPTRPIMEPGSVQPGPPLLLGCSFSATPLQAAAGYFATGPRFPIITNRSYFRQYRRALRWGIRNSSTSSPTINELPPLCLENTAKQTGGQLPLLPHRNTTIGNHSTGQGVSNKALANAGAVPYGNGASSVCIIPIVWGNENERRPLSAIYTHRYKILITVNSVAVSEEFNI